MMLARTVAALALLTSVLAAPTLAPASDRPVAAKLRPPTPPLLARGFVVIPGATSLPAGSVMTVELRDISLADAPSRLIARRVYRGVKRLPASFELYGAHAGLDPKRQRLSLSVSVRLANDSEEAVGDYISESNNTISRLGGTSLVRVSKLEHCNDPDAGGFCTTRVR